MEHPQLIVPKLEEETTEQEATEDSSSNPMVPVKIKTEEIVVYPSINLDNSSDCSPVKTPRKTRKPSKIKARRNQKRGYKKPKKNQKSVYKKPKENQKPADKTSVCEVCSKSFTCPSTLRDHSRIHTGEKPFKCLECGMCFTQRSNWSLHRRVHTGEKPYMCGVCGKTFARGSHLEGHARTHTGEKPFRCNDCDYCGATSQALRNHQRVHTGEKPFVCTLCSARYAHLSSLSSHRKICGGVRRKPGRPPKTKEDSQKHKKTGRQRRSKPRRQVRPIQSRPLQTSIQVDHDSGANIVIEEGKFENDSCTSVIVCQNVTNGDVEDGKITSKTFYRKLGVVQRIYMSKVMVAVATSTNVGNS